MQIVWDPEAVEQLKKAHTVLELETFETSSGPMVAYCVVPAEHLYEDLPRLGYYTDLHAAFAKALNEKNYKLCIDTAEHLMGHFGGELDSFYIEILARITK